MNSIKFMLLYISSLIFYAMGIENSFAQVLTGMLSGTVTDARTNEPLVGVNVVVIDTPYGAATDAEGRYKIERLPVGTYRLRFDYIGYDRLIKTDIVVKSSRNEDVNASLMPAVLEGEEVVVTAGYFAESMKAQTSVIGLSREEIRRYPGGFEDVVRTVSTLPGVAVNNAGGRNDLLVRGGGPSENLYVINGIEVPNINHFGTQGAGSGSLSFVNLDFVQDVAFSTGGFGARYGDKMSSVLSLTMVESHSTSFDPKLVISATQYGFDFRQPISGHGSLIFSARRSYLDLIFKAAGLAFVPVYTDFNLIGHYDLSPKDKLFFLSLSAINDVDRDLSTLQNRIENAGILGNDQYQAVAGVTYRRILPTGYLDAIISTTLFKYGFRQADPNLNEFFRSDSREREVGSKLEHYWVASKTLGLRSGLSAKTMIFQNDVAFADFIYDRNGNFLPVAALGIPKQFNQKKNALKTAVYAETDWLITPKFQVNAGVRLDHFDFLDLANYPAPRLALEYKVNPRNSVKFSSGIYYQAPSYVWLTNPVNTQLKALRNTMAVFGWNHLLQEDTRLVIETYYKKYDNLPTGTAPGINDHIVITNTGTDYGGSRENFQSFGYFDMVSNGKGRAYGADLLLQKKFSNTPFYGLAGVTINKTELTAGNGLTYPGQYDQRFILNISGGYKPNRNWEFSAKFRYYTGVPYTPVYVKGTNPKNPQLIQNLPEEYLVARLPAAHHLDVRVDRYLFFKGATLILYVDIQNVYNYPIPLRPSYNFWDNTITTKSQIGILPSIGISLEM